MFTRASFLLMRAAWGAPDSCDICLILTHWRADGLARADPRVHAGATARQWCGMAAAWGPDIVIGRLPAAPHACTVMPAAAHVTLMRFRRLCVLGIQGEPRLRPPPVLSV